MKPLNYINLRKIYPLLQNNSFPFLEKTFDDIDEYAILARLQKALLEIGENNNNLNDNFTELNNYVTNYFKNLDVQDEVDNKLQQMANDGTLDAIINKYITNTILRIYETVSDMKADSTLQEGMICKTLGFYNLGDNGASSYKISANLQANESNIIALNNGLFAEFVPVTNIINVMQFGCKEDNTSDDTDNLQNLINYADSNFIITGNNKQIKITKTLYFTAYTKVENLYINMYEGNYEDNYLIKVNTQNYIPYAYNQGYIKNCKFYNLTNNYYNCIYNRANINIEYNLFSKFNIAFRVAPDYLDMWIFNNNQVFNDNLGHNENDYSVNLGYLGDSNSFNNNHITGGDALIINSNHNPIILNNNIINGNISILGNAIVKFNGLHMEGGNITISDNSKVTIEDFFLYHQNPNILLQNYSQLILKNGLFVYILNNNLINTNDIDISLGNNTQLNCENVFKTQLPQDSGTLGLFGIKTSRNNIPSTKSQQSYNVTNLPSHTKNGGSPNMSVGNIGKSEFTKWLESSGHYYYKVIPFIDIDRKILGGTIKTADIDVVQSKGGVVFTGTLTGLYRIYRGSSSNSFNAYADVALIAGNRIDDNGFFISGSKWNNLSEPINPQSTDFNTVFQSFEFLNDDKIIGSIPDNPTKGLWKYGDIICTTSGIKFCSGGTSTEGGQWT